MGDGMIGSCEFCDMAVFDAIQLLEVKIGLSVCPVVCVRVVDDLGQSEAAHTVEEVCGVFVIRVIDVVI